MARLAAVDMVLAANLIALNNFLQTALSTCLLISASALPSLANSAVIEGVGCGTGCYQSYEQVGPVTRTRNGYPRVQVAVRTTGGREGDSTGKNWVIADCQGNRVALYSPDGEVDNVFWSKAFTESGEPNNCHSACGRAFDQWRLLCSAAGEL